MAIPKKESDIDTRHAALELAIKFNGGNGFADTGKIVEDAKVFDAYISQGGAE